MVSARNADIYNKEGTWVPANEFLRCPKEAEYGPEEATVRWAEVLNDCEKLALQFQGLPGFQLRRTS
jgi:hypothetical protein